MTGKEQQPSEAKPVAIVAADAHYSIFAEANRSMDETLISAMYRRANTHQMVAATMRGVITDTFSKLRVC